MDVFQILPRLEAIERRMANIDIIEKRLSIMQEVQNELAVEMDAIKAKLDEKSGSHPGLATVADVMSTEKNLRDEIVRMRKTLVKELTFASESESDQEEYLGIVGGARRKTTSAVRYNPGVDPDDKTKRPRDTSSATSSWLLTRDRAVQTDDTWDQSTQAEISEQQIYDFVMRDFRSRCSQIIEDTMNGRMADTIHYFIDKTIQKIIGDNVGDRSTESVNAELKEIVKGLIEEYAKQELADKTEEQWKKVDMIKDEQTRALVQDILDENLSSYFGAAAYPQINDGEDPALVYSLEEASITDLNMTGALSVSAPEFRPSGL